MSQALSRAEAPLKIQIVAWACQDLLEGTPYKNGQVFEGTLSDALRIMGEFFLQGHNVTLTRTPVSIIGDGVHLVYQDAVRIWIGEDSPR